MFPTQRLVQDNHILGQVAPMLAVHSFEDFAGLANPNSTPTPGDSKTVALFQGLFASCNVTCGHVSKEPEIRASETSAPSVFFVFLCWVEMEILSLLKICVDQET